MLNSGIGRQASDERGANCQNKNHEGFMLSAGSIGVQSVKSEELKKNDSGELYLTNKRIILLVIGNPAVSNWIKFWK